MYIEVSNKEMERFKEISDITITDYEFKGNFVPVVSLLAMIDDLLLELHEREEQIENIKQDIQDNYKRISEQVGISDKDFI
jgi:aspartokinase